MRSKAYGVIAVLWAFFALQPSVAQTQREIDALFVVQRDVGVAMRQLQAIRALPDTHDDRIIRWVYDNRLQLLPPFLMELARRQFARDPDIALESVAVGWMRARYDGFRCADRTAAQGADMIVRMAGESVLNHQRGNPASFSKAGLRTLQRPDLFKQGGSDPAWLCSHGIDAYVSGLGGKAPDRAATMKPEREWPAIERQLREHFSRYFEDLAKPPDDPVPLAKDSLSLQPVAENIFRYWWNGDGALVSMESLPREKRVIYRMWRPGRTSWTILESRDRISSSCVADGQLYIAVGSMPFPDRPAKPTLLTRYRLSETAEPADQSEVPYFSAIEVTPDHGGSFARFVRQQSHLDCSIIDDAYEASTGSYWLRLRQDHGWIRFRATNATQFELSFHSSRGAPGKPVGVVDGGYSASFIRWYQPTQRYFVPARNSNLLGWWIHPPSGRIDPVVLQASATFKGSTFYPSGDRWITISRGRSTAHGHKSGGVYLRTASGREVKIVDSFVSSFLPSPDGCWLAINHTLPTATGDWPRAADQRRRLDAVNLCDYAER